MTPTTTTVQWDAIRAGLDQTSSRFVELLRSVDNGEARAVGEWTIADTAAHVATLVRFDTYAALGTRPPAELSDLVELANTATPADVVRLNAIALERYTERDLGVLADEIAVGIDELLTASTSLDGTERTSWLGGVNLGVAGVLGHLLSEFLLHGFDIARAAKLPWSVPSPEAALTFEVFLTDVLRGISDAPPGTNFACEFHVEGATPAVVVSEAGRLSVEQPGRRVDVRIKGDAAALALVMYGRISPLGPLLRRQIHVFGRRPWRVRQLLRMVP